MKLNQKIRMFVTILFINAFVISCNKAPEKEFNTDDEIIAGDPIEVLNSIDKNSIELIINTQSDDFDDTIQHLSDFFLSNFNSEAERAYAIYFWIITNISYDYNSAENTFVLNESTDKIVQKVFENRKGICDGYSRLFCVFCEKSDLEPAYIDGFTPSNNMNLQDPLLYGSHAWNAIRINGKWYLLDTTWSLFVSDPIEFYNQHLPYDEKWKLF